MIDLTGQKIGNLLIVQRANNSPTQKTRWLCLCDCGAYVIKNRAYFWRQRACAESCGCLSRETITKHGGEKSPEYSVWSQMKSRCLNSADNNYYKYGALGVQVCQRYRTNFNCFRADLGLRPSENHSLDRINTFGHYSCGMCLQCQLYDWPANLRWTTLVEQNNNRKNVNRVFENNRWLTIREYAEYHKITHLQAYKQLKKTDRLVQLQDIDS